MAAIKAPSRIAIIGLGLIGGSIALKLKAAHPHLHLVGCSASSEDALGAQAAGAIDTLAETPSAAAAGADLAVLATPPATIAALVAAVSDADGQVLITDTGSVKAPLLRAVQQLPAAARRRIVPAHPITGSHNSGFTAARGDLFAGCRTVITPLADGDADALATVEQFWQSLGAQIVSMDGVEHDRIFAAVSHLPHLVAWALFSAMNRTGDGEEIDRYGAAGLRDGIRLAASDPLMWSQVVTLNRDELLASMNEFSATWEDLKQLVESGGEAKLCAWLEQNRRDGTGD